MSAKKHDVQRDTVRRINRYKFIVKKANIDRLDYFILKHELLRRRKNIKT